MNKKCGHCGNIHEFKCPLVKAIEYYEDGTVKRVEYMTPADYGAGLICAPITVPVYQYPNHRPSIVVNPSYPQTSCGSHFSK